MCSGFTPQYKGLEALYKKYKDQNFVILGFPCNQVRDVLCALASLCLSQFSNPPHSPSPCRVSHQCPRSNPSQNACVSHLYLHQLNLPTSSSAARSPRTTRRSPSSASSTTASPSRSWPSLMSTATTRTRSTSGSRPRSPVFLVLPASRCALLLYMHSSIPPFCFTHPYPPPPKSILCPLAWPFELCHPSAGIMLTHFRTSSGTSRSS